MKIVVRMLGGLGNQLFQYAYARYISSMYPESKIYLDLREYRTYKVREFELDSMLLNESVFKFNKEIDLYYDLTRKGFHIYQFLKRKKYNKPLELGIECLIKKGLIYSGISAFKDISVNRKQVYLYGYFQDINIVEPIRKELLLEFTYKKQLSIKAQEYFRQIMESERSIAISIRCGKDYIESNWPVCSIEYYKNGLEILKKRNRKNKIFIFADDIELVKKEFNFEEDVVYIEGCNALESLELLKTCDDFVISNSSFAWWGAYLSQDTNKLIIAPSKWFAGLELKETALFLPDKMIILD